MPSIRTVYLIMFAICAGSIGIALYMQHAMELTPCYLCITQRVFVMAVGAAALLAFLHNPADTGQRVYGCITASLSAVGGRFSIRQLWLQSLPEDKVPACGPPADYLFDAFPLAEALTMLLRGDGNCAEVQWSFLGLSIPGWVLVLFSGLLLISIYQIMRAKPNSTP